VAAVAETHDDAVVGFGGDGEFAGQRFFFDDEGMVTRGGEGIGKLAKNIFVVVMNLAGFAVKKFWGADDFSAKGNADGLVAQANAQDGKFSGEAFDEFNGDAGFLRSAGTWGNDDALWLAADDFFDGDFIVAVHFDGATQFAEILREVISEGIVVVEKQNHDSAFVSQF
jgi:hypothetical protein